MLSGFGGNLHSKDFEEDFFWIYEDFCGFAGTLPGFMSSFAANLPVFASIFCRFEADFPDFASAFSAVAANFSALASTILDLA